MIHAKDGREYRFDTREMKARLKDVPLASLEGMKMIKEDLKKDTPGA